MNTFGTLLLRIGRPWLGVPLPAIDGQDGSPDQAHAQECPRNITAMEIAEDQSLLTERAKPLPSQL